MLKQKDPAGMRNDGREGNPEITSLWKARALTEYMASVAFRPGRIGNIENLNAAPKSRWAMETISDYARNARCGLIEGDDRAGMMMIIACFRMIRKEEISLIRKDLECVSVCAPQELVRAMARRALGGV